MDFSSFNVCSYFGYLFFKAGSFFGYCRGWKGMKTQLTCKEEMIKQLDVKLFLRRFNFFERAVEAILASNGME